MISVQNLKTLISGGADAMKGIVTYLNFHNDAPVMSVFFQGSLVLMNNLVIIMESPHQS